MTREVETPLNFASITQLAVCAAPVDAGDVICKHVRPRVIRRQPANRKKEKKIGSASQSASGRRKNQKKKYQVLKKEDADIHCELIAVSARQ